MRDSVAEIMRSTRAALLPFFGNVPDVRHKSDGSPVTDLDAKVEEMLKTALYTLDPSIAFVGEEGGGDRSAERLWLSDPIDGTAHFIRGTRYCTTMLALVEHGEVTLSAIYDFLDDKLYMAEKGRGATCNDEPIHVSGRPLSEAYLSWETHLNKEENMEKFLKMKQSCTLFNTISAGHEFVLVATGKIEGRVTFDPQGKDYDFAPGCLLVKEAGGVVTNIGSHTYDYRNVNSIAANPKVHQTLTEGPNAIFPATN